MSDLISKTGVTLAEESLQYHREGKPGKLAIIATKPMSTQRDLSLAYSPGVAAAVEEIAQKKHHAYDYTAKGNMVAVISNGTAILGLGNLGALAAKPVMEGKSVLFKRFADIDSFDIEVDTQDIDEFINCVRYLSPAFGGINLEDIKAPDCFIIESRLRELMDIPVFHDDQHGTAIIAVAGLLNALYLTKRDIAHTRLVCNGAGAAGIACIELVKAMGMPSENVILCDTKGVIYKGREKGMNQWKSAHAVDTEARTLEDAMKGADVFFGLSVKGALTEKMARSMNDNPIVFAMANPEPEITPEEMRAIRQDAIMATGRSDYPNQINNVLGFPYIFRGALDVRASRINDAMKIAAAKAIAKLARADVPDEVAAAYHGRRPRFGPEYIIPAPFDPRLIEEIPAEVAMAAMQTKVANHIIADLDSYKHRLSARLNPIVDLFKPIYEHVKKNPKRVVFAEGEEEQVMRAAIEFSNQNYGKAILVGRENEIHDVARAAGLEVPDEIEIWNARLSRRNRDYANYLYSRKQREGFLLRDCQRLVNTDRNIFGASMLALGDADAMVTGVTRNFTTALNDVRQVIDAKQQHRVIGLSIALCSGKIIFIADTAIHDMPTGLELADIAQGAASVAKRFGYKPRVALLAFSSFGYPRTERSSEVREAVKILTSRDVDFEFDGDMAADVALDRKKMSLYPFCKLTDTANVLVMPAYHSASISTNMLNTLSDNSVIGPYLVGLEKPIQIASLNATATDIVNLATLAAYDLSL